MKKKSIIKMIVDLLMTILLPLLMIQALAGEELHEWIGILICIIFSAISGILLSQYVFTFLNINQGISFARAAHMICTHWMFVLTSFHLGMHMKIMKGYLDYVSMMVLFAVIGYFVSDRLKKISMPKK